MVHVLMRPATLPGWISLAKSEPDEDGCVLIAHADVQLALSHSYQVVTAAEIEAKAKAKAEHAPEPAPEPTPEPAPVLKPLSAKKG